MHKVFKSLLLMAGLFTCTANTLNAQSSNNWIVTPYDSLYGYFIRNINILDNGEIWLGTTSNGAVRYWNNTWTSFTTSNSGITDNDVREISKDSTGRLWMATWSGLSAYDPANNSWQGYDVSANYLDILYSVEIDDEGRIWVGTDGGADPGDGLYLWPDSTFYDSSNSPLGSNWVTALETDNDGNIWACGQSIVKITGTTFSGIPVTMMGMPQNSTATAIDFDNNNHIWVGVYDGGIAYYDGNDWTIWSSANSPLPENKIWSLEVDPNNNVWIGTENAGLVRFDGVNWTIYDTSNSPITHNRIQALNCDAQGNIWIAPMDGSLLVHNPEGFASVSGKVFHDADTDSLYTNGEQGLSNTIIAVSPGGYFGVTDNTGHYNIPILDSGEYTVIAHVNSNWLNGIYPDTTITVIAESTSSDTIDFAVQLVPDIEDVSVVATAVTAARPGFFLAYNLTVRNTGTIVADSLLVSMVTDAVLPIDSLTGDYIFSTDGDTVYWQIDSLQLGEQRMFNIYITVPANVALLGDMLTNIAEVTLPGDNFPENNRDTLRQIVTGSYDPNDKTATPAGVGSYGYIPLETEQFDYLIRFQNTGNDTAFRIVVIDTLSSFVEVATFNTITASHPYSLEIKPQGVAVWTFNNILLPDSTTNEPGSHGFVRYSIRPKADVAYGDTIFNTANIYFDYNPPIITNTTVNTFYDFAVGLVETESGQEQLIVYPNPSVDGFLVKTNENMYPLTIELYTTDGKRILTKSVGLNERTAVPDGLTGILIYRVFNGNGTLIGHGRIQVKG
jgi:streptogramin lyase